MQQLSQSSYTFQEIKEEFVNTIIGPLFHVKHLCTNGIVSICNYGIVSLLLPPHFFSGALFISHYIQYTLIIGPQLSRQSGKLLTSRSQVRALVVQPSPISSVAEHPPCQRRVISSNLILGSIPLQFSGQNNGLLSHVSQVRFLPGVHINDKTHSEADPNGLCYAEA